MLARCSEVFGGEDVGVDCREEGGSFGVCLVGSLSRSSWLSS